MDWLLILVEQETIFSIRNGEWDAGGVKRLTIDIEFDDDSLGVDDKHGENEDDDDDDVVCWINEHVERVWSIVSCWIIFGKYESYDENFSSIDDKHGQWPSDVSRFINVKRIGIWKHEAVDFNELIRSESFNSWSLESYNEICVIEECGKICCIYERRMAIGIELWHWR